MLDELLRSITPVGVVVFLVLFFIVRWAVISWRIENKIQRLGGHAPIISAYLPLSSDFLLNTIRRAQKREDILWWQQDVMFQGTVTTAEVNPRAPCRNVFTQDPENIKAILTGQFWDYGKGKQFHAAFKDFLGDGIFATDGDLWSASRHLIRPIFARERLVDTEIFESHIQKLISVLQGSHNSPAAYQAVDVGEVLFNFTLDASMHYILGHDIDSLSNPRTEFAEAFAYVQRIQAIMSRGGPLRHIVPRREFRRQLRVLDGFLEPFIDHVLSLSPEELEKKLSKEETFIHGLARFTRSRKVLRDQLINILLAGRDTTAGTLMFCLFELSRHPDVVQRAREEVLQVAGRRKPTYKELKDMRYLTSVLNETLRLYPVVPFNMRYSLKDTTLPRGGGPSGADPIGIQAGTRITYSTMNMQRDRRLYPRPEDATEKQPYYDPGMWVPERWQTWQPKPWQFIPFNGGPRICLGQQFAMIEMAYTLTRILQHFTQIKAVNAPPPGVDPGFKFDITLSANQELNCIFVPETEVDVPQQH